MFLNLKNIRNVFLDIDDTIAHSKLGYSDVGYFEYVLAGISCRLKNLGFAQALERVLEAERKYPFLDPFAAIADLDIPLEVYRLELVEFQKIYLHVFEDAVDLVKALKQKGYGLYVTSNNSLSRAYAAIHAAGLSDWEYSDFFSCVFSPENTGFNKSDIRFYKEVIASGNFNPDEMLVIGDSPEADARVPEKAGIRHTVIIDRKKKLPEKDKFTVSDLRDILNSQSQERKIC